MDPIDICVLTLDAGGTHFVFGAVKGGKIIVAAKVYAAEKYSLDDSIDQIKKGFESVIEDLNFPFHAISFSFPGPSHYEKGRVGPLLNLPCYSEEVPLKDILELYFKVPVYINNDGNLFALGEALHGRLAQFNQICKAKGIEKKFSGLIGLTLGTGLGAGFVYQGNMLKGDNGLSLEIWANSSVDGEDIPLENLLNAQFVRERFAHLTLSDKSYSPLEIYNFAKDSHSPHFHSAQQTFRELGEALGKLLCSLINTFDVCIVIGGGLSGASDLFLPPAISFCNGSFPSRNGSTVGRTINKVYIWPEMPHCMEESKEGERFVWVAPSVNSTFEAVALGAYEYARSKVSSNGYYGS